MTRMLNNFVHVFPILTMLTFMHILCHARYASLPITSLFLICSAIPHIMDPTTNVVGFMLILSWLVFPKRVIHCREPCLKTFDFPLVQGRSNSKHDH